jgi:hypothetical protein
LKTKRCDEIVSGDIIFYNSSDARSEYFLVIKTAAVTGGFMFLLLNSAGQTSKNFRLFYEEHRIV